MRFLGADHLLKMLSTNEPKNWLDENATITKKNFTPDKVYCVTKISLERHGKKVDCTKGKVTFVETGDSLIKEEKLMDYLWDLFKKGNGNEEHEILLFYGRVDDTKAFLKRVEMVGVMAREKEVVDRLPSVFRRRK